MQKLLILCKLQHYITVCLDLFASLRPKNYKIYAESVSVVNLHHISNCCLDLLVFCLSGKVFLGRLELWPKLLSPMKIFPERQNSNTKYRQQLLIYRKLQQNVTFRGVCLLSLHPKSDRIYEQVMMWYNLQHIKNLA